MVLEQLKIFISVVDGKSFTKAAEQLYISHSTTSRNVAALEAELGVRLLTRGSRTVRLTAAGELLYHDGKKLLRKVAELEASVKNAGRGLVGRLNVATADIGLPLLSESYKGFCRRYPDLILGVYYKDPAEVLSQVDGGEADVGITFSFALEEDRGDLIVTPLARERLCLAISGDNPISQRKSIRIEDLSRAVFITVPASPAFIREIEEKAGAGRENERCVCVPNPESMYLQVGAGNGVAIVPRPASKEPSGGCVFIDIENAETEFDVVMIQRKDNLNPSIPLLTQAIQDNL